jgi:hypothetical protein
VSVDRVSFVEAAHRNMAACRTDLDRAGFELDRVFRHYQKAQAELREIGIQADALLSPPLEAAFAAWLDRGAQEKRLELTAIGPVPMMEDDE